ncbi:MAG: DUF2318 domain-containing protein [Deltaproteobacteria bacterium]|nr:DUF2318 domain-containing protein [Deltaproteobacteria bacterium]
MEVEGMKKLFVMSLAVLVAGFLTTVSHAGFWQKTKLLTPKQGELRIPVADVSDGKAHFFKVKSGDGTMVTFFVLKSKDGVIRAALNACDECYRAGKGYVQDGDFMVCEQCGRRFFSDKINVIAGGCNPVGIDKKIQADQLVIGMKDINSKSWYCQLPKK